ncbi:dihydrodipicolinate synthase family protein [Hyphomicrobium sp.]|uniref:dihydrodipicolinate synthase family protein n=1 Tax=Hyphomicrobium sp. TaxID=82 RepID=UPI0025BE143B|nr:dihydrodipicolinate synthase family protein [Hyphomicrobium sp.]MCC7251356.1 dihydrodipicolinate synthase family protein [Hyphomicrobium sp.]
MSEHKQTERGGYPLWVPNLTHFKPGAPGGVDQNRIAAQIAHLRPHVSRFLLAGSTGDGWEIDDTAFAALIELAQDGTVFPGETRLMFGALRPTTDAVIARARLVEERLAKGPKLAAQAVGHAVCPPVEPGASQETILDHYRRVLRETEMPIAVYQLPQVTQCAISVETMRALADEPKVVMFKDSSGEDAVAKAGATKGVLALRGAEGRYSAWVAPDGPYDGWLLSSGNSVPELLDATARHLASGETAAAAEASAKASQIVDRLFAAAAPLTFGNAFSNANRAADHIRAWGPKWRAVEPPLTASGNRLPETLLAEADAILKDGGIDVTSGYLDAEGVSV